MGMLSHDSKMQLSREDMGLRAGKDIYDNLPMESIWPSPAPCDKSGQALHLVIK